jgi:hypothetical protein
VVSKDNQELTITGGLTFHLDTSCDDNGGALRAFHEEIGLKFQPVLDDAGKTTGTGLKMLRFYIGQPLAKALTTEAVGVLGPDGYILYDTVQRCLTGEAPKGCPSFLPLPPGGTVQAPAPAPAAS